MKYEVRVIKNRTSFTPVALQNAVPGEASLALNNWGAFDFNIPVGDAQVSEVKLLEREIQLWAYDNNGLNGKCVWWGIPVRARADDQWLNVQCYGLEWYFSRLYFGPVQTNYVANGDFEAGLSNWTAVGCAATVDTSWKSSGTNSVRLVATAMESEAYLRQFIEVSAFPDLAVVFKASAVMRIDPATPWIGPALYERGLYIARLADGVVQGEDYVWEPITEDTKRDGTELFLESPEVTVPAGETQTIEVRLYCPGGAINWDLVSVKVQESVSAVQAGEDASTLITRIATYAQNESEGKKGLNIGIAAPPTGRTLFRAYQFYDNGSVWEALSQFADDGICDIGIVWNSNGTSRTFTVFPMPNGRGAARPGWRLDLDESGLVAGMVYDIDGVQTATKVRALGQGNGATREVGEAIDTSEVGGMVLEDVINTPVETLVGQLDSRAQAELAKRKAPVKIPRFVLRREDQLVGVLTPGDRLPVSIDYGWVQEHDERRVVAFTINPSDHTVTPTFN